MEKLAADSAVLVGDNEYYLLTGAETVAVVSQIDGSRTMTDIIAEVSGVIPELRALDTIVTLEAKGLIEAVSKQRPDPFVPLLEHGGTTDEAPIPRLRSRAVFVVGHDVGPARRLMESTLRRFGLRVEQQRHSPGVVFQLVLSSDLFDLKLSDLQLDARGRNLPWCLVQPWGIAPFVSSPFGAAAGACFQCLTYWISINRPVETYLRRRGIRLDPARLPYFEPAARIVFEIAALTVARMIAGNTGAHEESTLTVVNGLTLTAERHVVRRRPQCPVCGDSSSMRRQGERPIALADVQRGPWEDGGYRRQSPSETLRQFAALISPVTGAISHLGPMPKKNAEERAVYVSSYRVVPTCEEIDAESFQRVCAGKGRDAEQAKVSALGEALERFSGVYQGDEACVWASRRELGSIALAPDVLLGFSAQQYERRRNRDTSSIGERIPLRADPDTRLDWTPAWSLTYGQRRLVPLSYCYAETPPSRGAAYCPHNGNGAASGTCIEEAILQGLFEVLERDAVAIWWYNRVKRPEIDLMSFDDPYFLRLKSQYAKRNLRLWLLNLTCDFRVPVYAALAHNVDANRFSIGMGCHLNARIAAGRALTELNQLFDPDGEYRPPWDATRMDTIEFLYPSGTHDAPESQCRSDSGNLRDAIVYCMNCLKSAGLDLVVVDKTRPDIGMHVAHVIVPGLRHFRPRFAPGRLYTVPTDMGWQPRPLRENELNPVPLLL